MRKLNLWLLMLSLVTVLYTSCDNKSINGPECDATSVSRIPTVPFHEDSVVEYVCSVYETLFPEEFERYSIDATLADIEYFTDSVLKIIYNWHNYDYNDTILRIINFGSDKGYAVCSNLGIIAISPNGQLPLSDCTATATDEWISANMPNYYITTLVDQYALNMRTGDLFARTVPDGWRDFATSDFYVVNKVGPLVPVKMSQNYPFNYYCPERTNSSASCNGHAPAGCCAIAIAQVFASKMYPSTIDEVEGNWNGIINDCEIEPIAYTNNINILAKWIRSIGDGVNMFYFTDESYQPITNNILTYMSHYSRFSNLAYSTVGLNSTTYLHYIDHGNALIVRGDVANGDPRQGHYWNVDGYCTIGVDVSRIIYATGEIVNRGTRTYKLAHCNWGWGGTYDGYYMFGDFDFCSYFTMNRFNELLEQHNPETMFGDRYNKNIQLITYDFN